MQKGLVSVVLPIYNVEKYLDRCLSSVVNQTYQNLEIILVDDESPDSCPELCEQWAQKDSRIKVVHKKNAGLGMARNTGIENATGQYICFFDSDDYIEPDTVEKCYTLAMQTHADVVSYGFYKVDSRGTVVSTHIPNCEKTLFSGREIVEEFLPDLLSADPVTGRSSELWLSACGALYSLELINKTGWRFVSERQIISEDVYSLMEFYSHVKKAAVLKEAFYYYCENGSSLTHTYRPDRYQKLCHFYGVCMELCDKLGYPDHIRLRLDRVTISYAIAALKMEASSPRSLKERRAAVKAIVCDPVMVQAVKRGRSHLDNKARKILYFAVEHGLSDLCLLLSLLKK